VSTVILSEAKDLCNRLLLHRSFGPQTTRTSGWQSGDDRR